VNILINCPSKFNLKSNELDKIGGIESLNIALAKELSNINFDVTLSSICNKKTKIKNLLNLPIKYFNVKKNRLNYDLVISSNDASIFNYFPNAKKILWLHNPLQIEKSIRKKQFISLLRHRPKVVFVSSYLESITSKLFFFKKRIVIPNFLLSEFVSHKTNYVRKKIFIWSVQRNKGLNEIINIWTKNINPFYEKVELHIFGLKKLPNNYSKKYLEHNRIFFKGRISKNDLKIIYNKSLAMICLGFDETFCLNALEANSCGLPILTFGKTALKKFVINNHNGFVVNNYSDLSNIIIEMINIKKIKHKKLIDNSILVSKNYHLNKVIHNWIKLL
jgi:glycosyltransferase involved in cell wall biosynthesis